MKINISYTSLKWYDRTNIKQWFWFYKPYKNVRGVIFRICGVYFNIREKNATAKLITLVKERQNKCGVGEIG
jgi:hypothetical protein